MIELNQLELNQEQIRLLEEINELKKLELKLLLI